MGRPKGSTIGSNPLDAVVPMRPSTEPAMDTSHVKHVLRAKEVEPAMLVAQPRREKVTVALPADMMERLRATAYWTRQSLAGLVEDGIRDIIAKEEEAHGRAFDPIATRLRPGRKIGG